MKVVGSRDFNQDVSQAKRLARTEPVFITDRGKPTHVLMSFEAYRHMSGETETIVDLLALPGLIEVEPEIMKSDDIWGRSEDVM
jgi:prevent-host-death family protein